MCVLYSLIHIVLQWDPTLTTAFKSLAVHLSSCPSMHALVVLHSCIFFPLHSLSSFLCPPCCPGRLAFGGGISWAPFPYWLVSRWVQPMRGQQETGGREERVVQYFFLLSPCFGASSLASSQGSPPEQPILLMSRFPLPYR